MIGRLIGKPVSEASYSRSGDGSVEERVLDA